MRGQNSEEKAFGGGLWSDDDVSITIKNKRKKSPKKVGCILRAIFVMPGFERNQKNMTSSAFSYRAI